MTTSTRARTPRRPGAPPIAPACSRAATRASRSSSPADRTPPRTSSSSARRAATSRSARSCARAESPSRQHGALQLRWFRRLVELLEELEHLRGHLADEGLALGGVAVGDPGAADLLRRVDEVPLQRQALRLRDLADALPIGPAHGP